MDPYDDEITMVRKPARRATRNYVREYDSDSGSSVVSVQSRNSQIQSRFGTIEPPDVLYSVDYVDESRYIYGSMSTSLNPQLTSKYGVANPG